MGADLILIRTVRYPLGKFIVLAPVVQTLDSTIHWINHYPLDNSIGFASAYPVDSAIHHFNNWGLICPNQSPSLMQMREKNLTLSNLEFD